MNSDELRARIEREIGDDWSRSNLHGCDLRQCLVQPKKLLFEDSRDPAQTIDLWLVLEEIPDSQDGYKIVYDERNNQFGLACPFVVSGRDGYLGGYGPTFFEAFDAM